MKSNHISHTAIIMRLSFNKKKEKTARRGYQKIKKNSTKQKKLVKNSAAACFFIS